MSATEAIRAAPGRVLIGGVGYRWMGDASFGLVLAEALAALDWPAGVEVADLGYGAIYVSQDIAAADPPYERVILLAAPARGRTPDRVYVRRWWPGRLEPAELQERIREAGAGVIDVDHLLAIGQYFDAWPADVRLVEFEPAPTGPAALGGAELTTTCATLLPASIELVRRQAAEPVARSSRRPSPGRHRSEVRAAWEVVA